MKTHQTVRAVRPSRFGLDPEAVEQAHRAKELSIQLYARLVQDGHRLFEEDADAEREGQLVAAGA
jgi:hypothetical protein